MQGVADPGCGGRELFEHRPPRYRAPGFVSHPLVRLSMALHTSIVRGCSGAKEGTARRRRWHAGGDRMACGSAAVIHLHAVRGTIVPHYTVPMPSAWSSAWPWTRKKYGPGRPPSSLHRTQAAPDCRLRSRATPGRSGCRKGPLTAWVAWARVPMGKYHSGRSQGLGSSGAPSASHGHSESGGAAGTVPVCRKWRALGVRLEGCREAEPLCRGCHWEAALGPAPGANPGQPARCGGPGRFPPRFLWGRPLVPGAT